MQENLIVYVIVAACVALIIGIPVAVHLLNKHIEKKVESTSLKIKKMKELNDWYQQAYREPILTEVELHRTLDSLSQFDHFNFWGCLLEYVDAHTDAFNQMISLNNTNELVLDEYQRRADEYRELKTDFHCLPSNRRKYRETEYRKYRELRRHDQLVTIKISISYTSPAGRSQHSGSRTYTNDDFRKALAQVKEGRRIRTVRNEERNKMTPSLRYAVLKRDHYRCVLCGRGQEDGVKLEVDHIIPIAKGGKTELSNLRTLCWDCNHGKSDSYDPYYHYAR